MFSVRSQVLITSVTLAGLIAACCGHAYSQTATTGSTTPEALGIAFVNGSASQFIVERDGRKYMVDVSTHEIQEVQTADPSEMSSSSATKQAAETKPKAAEPGIQAAVYQPGDDLVFSVPTGRRLDRHGMYINFTHRFPYEAAFSGVARGDTLLGLDDFAVSSFGVRYGLTSRLFVMAYRAPSIIGRPIEFMGGYNFLDENSGDPLNASIRFSIDGQNNFARNFTENFELTISRSLGRRAQLYAVPTFSIHNRPVIAATTALTNPPPYQPCSQANANGIDPALGAKPCANTFSLGLAAAVDIRPTVALIAEVTPTLMNGPDLGIHRPAYSFGIQKKILRHAFTFGFTNSPGTTVSQRAGTRATFLGSPSADKPSGLFVGFDLTRQTF
jgi:hypothetical protein